MPAGLPRPGLEDDRHTPWQNGTVLVNEDGHPFRAADVIEGCFTTAFPEGADLRELGSPIVVVRVEPATLRLPPGRSGWAPDGILAYSKICTHAGCAVALYRSPLNDDTVTAPRRWSVRATTPRSMCVGAPLSSSGPPDGRCLSSPWDPHGPCADRGRRLLRAHRPGVVERTPRRTHESLMNYSRRSAGGTDGTTDAVRFVDERLGASPLLKTAMRLPVPRPLVLLARRDRALLVPRAARDRHIPGAVLRASTSPTVYHGAFAPLAGQTVSHAFASTVALSYDVPAGLLIRQTHHWAALVFVAAISRASAADLLHRRVSQAPRSQLDDRADPADPGDPRGVRRLLAAG